MGSTTPLALRIEERSLQALKSLASEIGRSGQYSPDAPGGPPPRIDPTKTLGNMTLHGVPASEIYSTVATAVETIGLARRTGREEQPIAAEVVMTVDATWAAEREATTPGWRDAFLRRCTDLLIRRYGAERVISVTAHEDERAPHLHAIVLPIADITRSNRYGSKVLRKISYTNVFGTPGGRTEYTARRMRDGSTAETTETGRLQTFFADGLADLGVRRGAIGSATHRKHISRGQYYRLLHAMQDAVTKDLPADAPLPAIVAKDASTMTPTAACAHGWAAGYAAATAVALSHPLLADGANARLDRARRQDAEEATALALEAEREARRRATMTEMELKALRARLRPIPAEALNPWFGADFPLTVTVGGRTRRIVSAFDRLMWLHGMNGGVATDWLAQRFPENEVAGAAAECATRDAAEKAMAEVHATTSALRGRILRQIRDVYRALGVQRLRILAVKPKVKRDDGGRAAVRKDSLGMVLTPRGKSEKSAWTVEDVERNLDLLMAKNRDGCGIYAMPEEGNIASDILLIDDIERPANAKKGWTARTSSDVATFVETSNPNVYMRTSREKTQALYVLPRTVDLADHGLRNRLFRELNARFGDPEVQRSGTIVHTFRLPGFLNHKYLGGDPVTFLRPPHTGASAWARTELATLARRELAKRTLPHEDESVAWWTKEKRKKERTEILMLQRVAADMPENGPESPQEPSDASEPAYSPQPR